MNRLLTIPFFLLVLISSCKKSSDIQYNFPPKPDRPVSEDGVKLAAIMNKYAPPTQLLIVDAALGGDVISSKGNTYSIPPNSFVYKNGTPVSGNVDLKIREITSASEMILADKPTVASDGRFLKSYGEFKVTASQQGTEVFLKPRTTINVIVSQRDSVDKPFEIPMWDGDTVINYTFKGRDFENNVVSLTIQQPLNKGIDWRQNNTFANQSGNSLTFPLDKLGKWVNVDVLRPTSNATTLIGYFTNVFNPSTSANLLYFKIKGESSVIKFYDPVLNAPAGKDGFVSTQNKFNIGLRGTLVGIVYQNGKIYFGSKDITVANPEAGKTFMGTDLILEEMTENQLLTQIQSLDNK